MSIVDLLYCFFGIIFAYFIELLCYKVITKKKIKITWINILIFILIIGITYCNANYNYTFTRSIVSLLTIMIITKFVFDDKPINVVLPSIITYIFLGVVEIVLSIILVKSDLAGILSFDKNILAKTLFTMLVMQIVLLIIYILKKPLRKLINLFHKHKSKILILGIVLIYALIIILMFKNAFSTSQKSYVSNIILLVIFTIFSSLLIYEYLKNKKAKEKEEILLDFMTKYEKIIDKDRINRHEMLNNLIIIKSNVPKNNAKLNEVVNDIITLYENKGTNLSRNLYNLPSGLKGLIYYKIYDMESENIKVHVDISPSPVLILNSLNSKSYSQVCKIIGILLDNATEAASKSAEKNVLINIYNDSGEIIINIENSFKGTINLDLIRKKGFSTKGKGRGLGLYLVNQIISESDKFFLNQEVDNKTKTFVTSFIIKSQ